MALNKNAWYRGNWGPVDLIGGGYSCPITGRMERDRKNHCSS